MAQHTPKAVLEQLNLITYFNMETLEIKNAHQLVNYEDLFSKLSAQFGGKFNALVYFNEDEESIFNFYKSLLKTSAHTSKIYINTNGISAFSSPRKCNRFFNLSPKHTPNLRYETSAKMIDRLKVEHYDFVVVDDLHRVRFSDLQFHNTTKIHKTTTFIFIIRNNNILKNIKPNFPKKKQTQVTIYIGNHKNKPIYKITNQNNTI